MHCKKQKTCIFKYRFFHITLQNIYLKLIIFKKIIHFLPLFTEPIKVRKSIRLRTLVFYQKSTISIVRLSFKNKLRTSPFVITPLRTFLVK